MSKSKKEFNLRLLSAVLASIIISGCTVHIPVKKMPSDSEIIKMSKSEVNCADEQIIIEHKGNNPLLDKRTWTLACGTVQFECEMENSESASCTEA